MTQAGLISRKRKTYISGQKTLLSRYEQDNKQSQVSLPSSEKPALTEVITLAVGER